MATLELTLKRLLHNPQAIILPDDQTPPSFVTSGLQFEDTHFDGNTGDAGLRSFGPESSKFGPESSRTTGSFYMVDNGNYGKSGDVSESFYLVDKTNGNGDSSNGDNHLSKSMEVVERDQSDSAEENKSPQEESEEEEKEVSVEKERSEKLEKADTESKEKDVDVTKMKEMLGDGGSGEQGWEEENNGGDKMELVIEDDDEMTRAQRDVRDLLSSIKCIIGG